VGLHPSFRTVDDESMFRREKSILEGGLGISAAAVRQHYLRFKYPGTWRMQSDAGCTVDSTLGFAAQEGFRNGACHPFLCYDTTQGPCCRCGNPLLVMDGTLRDYRKLDPAQARSRWMGSLPRYVTRALRSDPVSQHMLRSA